MSGYQGQRQYNGAAAATPAQGGTATKSIYVPITGLFANKSGNGLSVMVTDSVLANFGNVAIGDKIVFFHNEGAEQGKPSASLKLIKAADLTPPEPQK